MRNIRAMAGMLAGLMLVGVAGCTPTTNAESPRYDTRNAPYGQPEPQRRGMTTKQKVVLLAGAAALYYMYNKHKNRQGHGPEGQYYRSRNGRIYFRDAKGQAHWVSPPTQPIQVPADEYERYTGRSVDGYEDGRVLREAPAGW